MGQVARLANQQKTIAAMEPLIVLIVVTLLARGVGRLGVKQLQDWRAAVRAGLAAMFLLTASAHFTHMRPDLVAMVPPWVPQAEFMVTFTGVCEIMGAVGLLIPRTRRAAAWCLIVMLVAMFPANVHAALAGIPFQGRPATPLVPRILEQLLFIGLLWWAAARAPRATRTSRPA
jgi:uncharacterized membrane protein